MPTKLNLELPDVIVENYPTRDDLERSVYENIVISEFQKGNLSIRESAKILGLTYEGFMEFLGQRNISFINASQDELEENYRHLKSFLRNYKKT